MADTDTIFALATPPGRSALAVFRISGRRAGETLDALTRRNRPEPRVATLRSIFHPGSGEKIDEIVATFFRGPASFTGDDLVELSVHGSRGVIAAVTSALLAMKEVRSAEPGEFTRRAYLAGKFDLDQAEAIADLIDSDTEFQRRQAMRLLGGDLGRTAEGWRSRLLDIAGELESALDFSDEGDVQEADNENLARKARILREEISRAIAVGGRSLALREGFTVVIAGPPNVGKSTLFNKLAGSELAIVTEFAGTTRDLLKLELDLDGVPVTIIDSAGVRVSKDPIEQIGIERAKAAAASADLVLWLHTERIGGDGDDADLAVWSKADLFPAPGDALAVSSNDSDSISHLVSVIRERALSVVGDGSEGLLARSRHLEALRNCLDGLERFEALSRSNQLELAAEECRYVNSCLGRLSGSYETEDVLGAIFTRFCIGK